MHRWLLLLFLIGWGAVRTTLILIPSEQTPWHALATRCNNGRACWLGISAAGTTAENAQNRILQLSDELIVDASPGQNIQWTHPEGYQGMMSFNRSSISFLELNIPVDLPNSRRIRAGDVILTFGQPDEIERRRSGEAVLYYYNCLLIVHIEPANPFRLSPTDPVNRITMPSPYGSWMDMSRQRNQRRAWYGFGSLSTRLE
ncbi:MAG: hypothetical protein L0154_26950 [Chloroflexi bacterium]|nr:hypothetical protein [Chloroflexota bacterium]